MKTITITLMLLLAATFSVQAQGFRGKGNSGFGGDGMARIEEFVEELDLTDEQIDQIIEIKADARDAMQKNRSEMRGLREEMRLELQKDEPSKENLYSLIDKIADLEKAGKKLRIDNMLAIRKVLTEEQVDEFKSMRWEDRKERRAERRERRRGRRHGGGQGRMMNDPEW